MTLADFQLVCENVFFDSGLMNVMLNKVAYHTLRGWIQEHQLALIWEYVTKSDTIKRTNYVEIINGIFAKLQAEAAAAGKAVEAGKGAAWGEAEEEITVVHQSAAGAPLVLPSAPKKPTARVARKAPIVFVGDRDAIRKAADAAASGDDGTSDKDSAEKAKKPFGNVGGRVGAIRPAPGLAQAKVAAQESRTEPGEEAKGENSASTGREGEAVEQTTTRKISYAKMLGS